MERAVLGVFLRDRTKNEEIRRRTRITNKAMTISSLKRQKAKKHGEWMVEPKTSRMEMAEEVSRRTSSNNIE